MWYLCTGTVWLILVMLILVFLAFHRIQFRVYHTWNTGAAFSSLAVSNPVIWSHLFQSLVLHTCFFDRAALSILAFSVFIFYTGQTAVKLSGAEASDQAQCAAPD